MGAGIFSDDLASDIRGDYRELIEDGVDDTEAAERIIAAYQHLDADEEHLLWLAMAASQTQLGRLNTTIKEQALDVIASGRGLDLWEEAGPKELAKRMAALIKLRDQLNGPQPEPKRLRRPWRHETDLVAGDVLSFTASNGQMALLRVLRIDDHRIEAGPVVEWLDWSGRSSPPSSRLERLKPRDGESALPNDTRPPPPATFRVARYRKKDPDWRDSDFTLAARIPARPQDDTASAGTYLSWPMMAKKLEAKLTT